jgi:outer membrane receptor protein involved in Fe transport
MRAASKTALRRPQPLRAREARAISWKRSSLPQKRQERLIDVPQSVSVLSSDIISRMGAQQFRDYADTIPGLNFTTSGAGYTQITMRGVSLGDRVATVAVYIDDIPTAAVGNLGTLDLGLFDVDRIEVLRGPQGTLYGASAMGGLVKYVTKGPDVTQFAGQAQLGVSSTKDGEAGYTGAGAVNIPLVDEKIALRASGFFTRDPGYIDNLLIGRKDVNGADIYGGRLDLLLMPTEALSVRLAAFMQNIERDGVNAADYTSDRQPVDGSFDKARAVAEPFATKSRLVSS